MPKIKKKKEQKEQFESVKIKSNVVNKVRDNKKTTGVPVGTFFEQAAEEKLTIKK